MLADVTDTRERILRAARELFAERGYGATAMAAIAARADVVRATVYNNFADKIDILATIIRRYLHGYVEIGQRLREDAVRRRSVFEQLEAMTQFALDWRIENQDLRGVIDMARHTSGSGWDEANAEADEALLAWLSEMHRDGEAQGLTHPGLDLDIATPAVYSMIESALSSFDVSTPRPARHLRRPPAHARALAGDLPRRSGGRMTSTTACSQVRPSSTLDTLSNAGRAARRDLPRREGRHRWDTSISAGFSA